MNKSFAGAVCLSLAAGIWGGMYVVSKYVLEYVPPITLVWLRYAVAFLFLFSVLWSIQRKRQQPRLSKQDWGMLIWIGFIGYFISIVLQFIGTKYSNAHTGALMTSATPAFMLLFGRLLLKEPFTLRKITALVISTLGVLIVQGRGDQETSYQIGAWLLIGAAVTWALLSVYVRMASERMSSLTITTYAIMFALLFTTPLSIWEFVTQPVTINGITLMGILYLGIVSTAGAFFLWNRGMELMEAGTGSLFFFFQPVVGALLGWLLLKEHLGVNFFLGGICIALGVAVAAMQPTRRKEENTSGIKV